MKSIHTQLEELGLSEKEVKVYLASLELGSATVQNIAGKSGVVRSSSYVAIGALTNRGLMSTFTKGKKEFFAAEKPEQLLRILKTKKKQLDEQESKLKNAMPELQALIALSVDKPEVKYYEGLDGLDAMREKIFESGAKELRVIANIDQVRSVISEEDRALHSIRIKKHKIKGREILVSSKKINLPDIVPVGWVFKWAKDSALTGMGEITIFDDYISLISYQDKMYGFLLKSEMIAATAKTLFDTAWGNDKLRDLRK